jgi:sarcosine oxidase subunit gamma
MLERVSPIPGGIAPGLSRRVCGMLLQYHAWPDRFADMARRLADESGAPGIPAPGRAVHGAGASLLRVHPQRIWVVSQGEAAPIPDLPSEIGAVLDLSHARTIIRIDAAHAAALLSRFVAVDLRPERFAVDAVAATPLHRVGVVLWRRREAIDILAPRSFAASIWSVLTETAARLQ